MVQLTHLSNNNSSTMSGYSFCFTVPADICPSGPIVLRTEMVFYIVYFKVRTQTGEAWNGYVQFIIKKTEEELQQRFPAFMFQQSTNDPAVYGQYAAFQGSLSGVITYGQPRMKTPEIVININNPLKSCKTKLKKKFTSFIAQALTPDHLPL